MNITEVKNILSGLGSHAKHSLGQHFLLDELVVEKMVQAGDIGEDDTVLEIGPGLGVLTKELTKSPARKIIACEKDNLIFEFLQRQVKQKNLTLINRDALILIPTLEVSSPFKVISNLPYNISSPVIISLLSVCPVLPEKIVLMVQKEVAQRLTAKPGDSNRGILTVFTELFGRVEILESLRPRQFYPPPKLTLPSF
jgi:16S rRNA (adenine1518-N6/adenine1519-N6)-dimethyltransferase